MFQFVVSALARLGADDEGQGMAEYGLILSLVAVLAIVALTFLGTSVGNLLNTIANTL